MPLQIPFIGAGSGEPPARRSEQGKTTKKLKPRGEMAHLSARRIRAAGRPDIGRPV
jgi:hypothetical protein